MLQSGNIKLVKIWNDAAIPISEVIFHSNLIPAMILQVSDFFHCKGYLSEESDTSGSTKINLREFVQIREDGIIHSNGSLSPSR